MSTQQTFKEIPQYIEASIHQDAINRVPEFFKRIHHRDNE